MLHNNTAVPPLLEVSGISKQFSSVILAPSKLHQTAFRATAMKPKETALLFCLNG
ncbi:hypothetical protein O185_13075 [Photorhabdus temperata J3]|uniref:Uncharacterized protein n=1 Tax=Photorhabdus temperata J3 TaxID=1389415 RepID=U7QX76_PHOTE|nr:hypothetical protein O185_13075 [Photorhabdus temperata J3]